ncbi:AraC family transcriptional regulator [Gracilibacillus sp. YIM 98692]|uniref:AraC family transcriptional regulator n=1 Tax=Gracilibacillus sp. YIM 98692 TaxID=2663532 RepID=UPI0013D5C969|nr:AraC family transcriptional regulator [Gracilibacillus sp. YIM 98692]
MKHRIIMEGHTYPLVQEIGFMYDINGVFKHPNRVMEHLHVFIYVKKGKLQVKEDGESFYLTKGSYLFLKKGTHHWGEDYYLPGSEWYYIHFYDRNKGNKMPEYTPYRQTSFIGVEAYDSIFSLPKSSNVEQPSYMETKCQKLLELYESTHPLRPTITSIQVFQLFLDLYVESLNESSYKKSNRIVTKMVQLFHKHKEQKLTSQQIADKLGMNYSYLSTVFKKQTGKSVTQYQNEMLIEQAMQMFRKGDCNVSEVSDALGFSNPFYFSRVFKRTIGVSPSAYLEQIYRHH